MIEVFTWTITRNGKVIRAKDHPFHFWIDDEQKNDPSADES